MTQNACVLFTPSTVYDGPPPQRGGIPAPGSTSVSHCLADPAARVGLEKPYSPPSGPAKRGCVLWVIIGGGDHGVVGRVKIDSCENCKGAHTLHWTPILPVARKPRFFCNTFFHKNEKIFWRISAIFQFCKLPKSRCKKTLVFL